MATILSHGIAALALGKVFTGERLPIRFWVASVVCAMLPDIDVIGFGFGVRYGDMLGHRGLTHSLLSSHAGWFRDCRFAVSRCTVFRIQLRLSALLVSA